MSDNERVPSGQADFGGRALHRGINRLYVDFGTLRGRNRQHPVPTAHPETREKTRGGGGLGLARGILRDARFVDLLKVRSKLFRRVPRRDDNGE